jgi:tRNA pseudouridine55 synthase
MPEMKKRPVSVYKLELLSLNPPFAEIFVHCSSGTYIRSLARDIALAAGSRAHLCALTRTQVAGFTLEEQNEETANLLRPIDKNVITALGLPWFEVAPEEAEKLVHGKPLEPILEGKELFSQGEDSAEKADDFSAAVFSGETLVAVVEKSGGGWKYGCVY